MIKILKNILPKKTNEDIVKFLCSHCQWYLAGDVKGKTTYEKIFIDKKHLGFSYDSTNLNFPLLNISAEIVANIVFEKLKVEGKIFRFLWNMYCPGQSGEVHVDHHLDNYISILYNLHTTDGGTEINRIFYKDEESEAKVFSSNIKHKGVGPTKNNIRFNLNIVAEIKDLK